MITLLKGMGKAYLKNQKIKKADKLYESKRTDRYDPNEKNISEDIVKGMKERAIDNIKYKKIILKYV